MTENEDGYWIQKIQNLVREIYRVG